MHASPDGWSDAWIRPAGVVTSIGVGRLLRQEMRCVVRATRDARVGRQPAAHGFCTSRRSLRHAKRDSAVRKVSPDASWCICTCTWMRALGRRRPRANSLRLCCRPQAGVRDRAGGRPLSPWPRHRAGDCLGDNGVVRLAAPSAMARICPVRSPRGSSGQFRRSL
jgi:hypothetical protein